MENSRSHNFNSFHLVKTNNNTLTCHKKVLDLYPRIQKTRLLQLGKLTRSVVSVFNQFRQLQFTPHPYLKLVRAALKCLTDVFISGQQLVVACGVFVLCCSFALEYSREDVCNKLPSVPAPPRILL